MQLQQGRGIDDVDDEHDLMGADDDIIKHTQTIFDLQEASQNQVSLGHWQIELADAFQQCAKISGGNPEFVLKWSEFDDSQYLINSGIHHVNGSVESTPCSVELIFGGIADQAIDEG